MGNFSKAIGAIVGGVFGLLAGNIIPVEYATPEMQGALTVLLSTLAVFLFPANRQS